MVKYVENKFDEDYIQTLGNVKYTRQWVNTFLPLVYMICRSKLHGKDNKPTKY